MREAMKEEAVLVPSGIQFDASSVRRSSKVDIIRKDWAEMQKSNRRTATRDANKDARTLKNRLNQVLGLNKNSGQHKKKPKKRR
jgi:hypothetical protein